jgi:hypothetical protein
MAASDLRANLLHKPLALGGPSTDEYRSFWGTVISLRQAASSRTIVSKAL